MLPLPPPTVSVRHAGRVVAVCTFDRVHLDPAVEGMPRDHPDRALIEVKCLIAGAILHGEADGPYDDLAADEAAHLLVGGYED